MALLVQNFCGECFKSECISGYFKTKKRKEKVPFATKLKGGEGVKTGQLRKDDISILKCTQLAKSLFFVAILAKETWLL